MASTADIVEELVLDLSGRGSSAIVAGNNNAWDCSVGGLPFLFGNSQQAPIRRQTAQFQSTRVDQEREPGEHSLDPAVWSRSQSSYHYGAGQTSQEPLETTADIARFRYERSAGVDVWTPGKASLLNTTINRVSDVGATQFTIGVNGGVLHASGTTLKYVTEAGAVTTVTYGGAAITALASDGANWYSSSATGIYKGSLPSGAGAVLWTTAGATVARWAKGRLMAGVGAALYELVGGAPPTLPTPAYTHPTSSWLWTDIAEGPNAIYASGYNAAGGQSSIYSIAPKSDLSGLLPPIQAVELPRGELVYDLYGYLGSFLGVGTSKGLRVATLGNNGGLELGPLLFTVAGGVRDMVGVGKFLYAAGGSDTPTGSYSTAPGLYRVDLSADISHSKTAYSNDPSHDKYAWSPDLIGPASGYVRNVTTSGTTVWFTVDGQGLYQQDLAHYVAQGWLQPGAVKFATAAPKAWRSLELQGVCPTTTSVAAFVSTSGVGDPAAWFTVGKLDSSTTDVNLSLTTAAPGTQVGLFTAFELQSDAAFTATPVLTAYQLRAVPMPIRNRLFQVPLLCFDTEENRSGQKMGVKGGAFKRLQAIEALEESAGTLTWADFTTGERLPVTIETVDFQRALAPSRGMSGAGGVLTLTLRTAH
jgi:hypothetical protein